ncbi:hypothetical protein AGDE_14919 [Angomonas deanei]|uniref:Uncharacterized protein n=1 Tax=Angomonas deanei TaxID=59799 RepID=A0A7G2CLN4_9TRYP|nr:hypothetical protein AGDE_14919 [Angomonas deanei]CAD2220736.1 hypothetical protein, conserved [Angomonas deanei]|eukprot:EPY19994.1 hypothetical protein AGDE_14919 [Angomonas deanei]
MSFFSFELSDFLLFTSRSNSSPRLERVSFPSSNSGIFFEIIKCTFSKVFSSILQFFISLVIPQKISSVSLKHASSTKAGTTVYGRATFSFRAMLSLFLAVRSRDALASDRRALTSSSTEFFSADNTWRAAFNSLQISSRGIATSENSILYFSNDDRTNLAHCKETTKFGTVPIKHSFSSDTAEVRKLKLLRSSKIRTHSFSRFATLKNKVFFSRSNRTAFLIFPVSISSRYIILSNSWASETVLPLRWPISNRDDKIFFSSDARVTLVRPICRNNSSINFVARLVT